MKLKRVGEGDIREGFQGEVTPCRSLQGCTRVKVRERRGLPDGGPEMAEHGDTQGAQLGCSLFLGWGWGAGRPGTRSRDLTVDFVCEDPHCTHPPWSFKSPPPSMPRGIKGNPSGRARPAFHTHEQIHDRPCWKLPF